MLFKALLLLLLSFQICEGGIPSEEASALEAFRDANPRLWDLHGWTETLPGFNSTYPHCEWEGITCARLGVTHIRLQGKEIGFLPPSFFTTFENLVTLDLSHNFLSHALPGEIHWGRQRTLMNTIDLSFNSIPGAIPAQLLRPNLRALNLHNNAFSGTLPSSLVEMTELWELRLANNSLRGNLPAAIGNLYQLTILNTSHCSFEGPLPESMRNVSQLSILDISHNQFSGQIPNLLAFPDLSEIYLKGNDFSGFVPSFLQSFTGIVSIDNDGFQCPILDCVGDIQCSLSQLSCECPCAPGGGECVYGSYECECYNYRYGSTCQHTCPGFNPDTLEACSGHGVCHSGISGEGTCSCNVGWGGPSCSKECPGGVENECFGFGECDRWTAECVCLPNRRAPTCFECAVGYYGLNCEKQCPGGDKPCNGNGACDDNLLGDGTCTCYTGYGGVACELKNRDREVAWGVTSLFLLIFMGVAVVGIIVVIFIWMAKAKKFIQAEINLADAEDDLQVARFQRLKEEAEKESSSNSMQSRKKSLFIDPI